MSGLGVLALIIFALWLMFGSKKGKGKAKAAPAAPQALTPARPPASKPISTPPAQNRSQHVTGSTKREAVRWIPAGQSVEVAGYTIPGGMLYFGTPGGSDWNAPKCVINPALSVARSSPDTAGQLMGYWPSYTTIPAQSRVAYLQWLAGGRRDPAAGIGYVFLYFYGLERRLLKDQAMAEADAIVAEVERLRGIYGFNNSFQRYSRDFLDAVDLLRHTRIDTKPQISAEPVYGLPPRLLIGLGAQIKDGKPIDADWMLAWLLAHPETRLRTSARRAFDEFCQLFRLRFDAAYPSGMVVKSPKGRIGKIPFRVASGDFSAALEGDFEAWPDVSKLTAPINKAMAVAEPCMGELDSYSRMLGKDPDAKDSLRAKLLLPVELLADAGGDVAVVRDWLRTMGRVVSASEALSRLGLAIDDNKLGKALARQLAETLERLGYGVEPDVRLGGRTPKPEEPVVIFALPDGIREQSPPGEAYGAAALTLALSALVIHADKVVAPEEERHLLSLVETNLHLPPMERLRLEAHTRWLLAVPPSMAQIQPRLAGLVPQQRSDLARFAIAMAAADGHVAVEEVKLLERLYKILGLEPTRLFSDLHALEAQGDEPVVVRPAGPVPTGRTIPRPVEPEAEAAPSVVLDMARIERIRSDTAKVSSLLSEIFLDEVMAEPVVPDQDVADGDSAFDGLDRRHEALLRELITRSTWPRQDFETLCRQMELMPNGALESLNEWAFSRFDDAVVEDDDPVIVNVSLLEPVNGLSP